MSSAREAAFLKESAAKAFEPRHRQIINYNIDKYDDAVKRGLPQFHHLENSKRKAHIIKWRVMENLDKLLPEFESNAHGARSEIEIGDSASATAADIQNLLAVDIHRHRHSSLPS